MKLRKKYKTMDLGILLGAIGTVSGLVSLGLHIQKRMKEKPIIEFDDFSVDLRKIGEKVMAEVQFNINNIGDVQTTISRIIVILGAEREFIENLYTIPGHSSIRVPKRGLIRLEVDQKVHYYDDDTDETYFLDKDEELTILIYYTHGFFMDGYSLPKLSDWEYPDSHYYTHRKKQLRINM